MSFNPSALSASSQGATLTSLATSSPENIIALVKCSSLAAELLKTSGIGLSSALPGTSLGPELVDTIALAADLARASGHPFPASSTTSAPAKSQAATASMTFAEFRALVRAAPPHIRALPVTSVESFDRPALQTAGIVLGHQYVVAGVLLPATATATGDPKPRHTYLRFDLYTTALSLGDSPGVLCVRMSDDRDALSKGRWRICELATAPGQPGPSLDALAALCATVAGRVGRGYSLLGRNCVWMNNLMVFGLARKFRAHWEREGTRLAPEHTMRRYIRGEIGMQEAASECNIADGTARWFANVGLTAVRGLQALITQNDGDRYLMHDDEMNELLRDWELEGYVPAAYPA